MKRMTPWKPLLCAGFLGILLASSSGCLSDADERSGTSSSGPGLSWFAPRATLPAGASLGVRVTSGITSETARAGDSWSGVLTRPTYVDGKEVLPAGSPVSGVVTGAQEAARGTRAMLDLAIQSVHVRGRDVRLNAGMDAIIAGSPRARNLGAIAGGVAGGALLGKLVGGDGHDAAVGGLIGGAAATGAVMASKGYQVVLKPGTVLWFRVSEPVAMRLED